MDFTENKISKVISSLHNNKALVNDGFVGSNVTCHNTRGTAGTAQVVTHKPQSSTGICTGLLFAAKD